MLPVKFGLLVFGWVQSAVWSHGPSLGMSSAGLPDLGPHSASPDLWRIPFRPDWGVWPSGVRCGPSRRNRLRRLRGMLLVSGRGVAALGHHGSQGLLVSASGCSSSSWLWRFGGTHVQGQRVVRGLWFTRRHLVPFRGTVHSGPGLRVCAAPPSVLLRPSA